MIRHPYGPDELDRTDPELDGIAEQLQDYAAGQSCQLRRSTWRRGSMPPSTPSRIRPSGGGRVSPARLPAGGRSRAD